MRSALRIALALFVSMNASHAFAQRTLTTSPTTYDFVGFTAAGFEPTPTAGELSSNEFQVLGGGSSTMVQCAFGATCNTAATVFTRGAVATSTANPSAGGVYAFQPTMGNVALGVQPSGSSTTAFCTAPNPGTITIAYVNGTGGVLTSITTSLTTWVHNNEDRSSTVTAMFSTGGAMPTTAMITTLATPAMNTGSAWASTPFSGSVDVSALSIGPGATIYLVLSVVDLGGMTSRDEIAWDDITLAAATPSLCGNGMLDGGEICDAGAMNGATSCGCQRSCTFGVSGTACGAAGGACDAMHTCDGAGACAAHISAMGTSCRPSAGPCDVAESCDGVSASCPTDGFAVMGTVCRAAIGLCDTAGVCSGTSITCPPDMAAPNGTSCNDGSFCNGSETCQNGTCMPGIAMNCADTNACTMDACMETSGGAMCTHGMLAGCCNPSDSCDDGMPCTADSCSGPGGTCLHAPISGCCTSNAQCTAPACATATCTANRCVSMGIVGCCMNDGDCASTNMCVTTHCMAGTCNSTPVAGCCNLAGDCDDHDACTLDDCTHAGGVCVHDPITDCCNADADCNDAIACTIDHCNVATHACSHDASTCTDSGAVDAGTDASAIDASASDAGTSDAGAMDAGAHDAGAVDAGPSDASVSDVSLHVDAPTVDAARSLPHPAPSCGCRTSSRGSSGLGLMIGLALWIARRRLRA